MPKMSQLLVLIEVGWNPAVRRTNELQRIIESLRCAEIRARNAKAIFGRLAIAPTPTIKRGNQQ